MGVPGRPHFRVSYLVGRDILPRARD
jgi:hypothetical protein